MMIIVFRFGLLSEGFVMRRTILFSLLLVPAWAAAGSPPELAPLPEPPALPSRIKSGEVLAPDPTVVETADRPPPVPSPEPPTLPLPVESGEAIEPDITIIRRGKKLIHEYRLNGQLYMVKIQPDIGPPYYLIDSNGDGNLNVRRSDLERGPNRINIPQWVLLSWK